jgi:hypothetical protein
MRVEILTVIDFRYLLVGVIIIQVRSADRYDAEPIVMRHAISCAAHELCMQTARTAMRRIQTVKLFALFPRGGKIGL